VGGELCLDFCNTMGGKRGGIAREYLHSYRDFLSWCEQAGLVNKSQAEALNEQAKREPDEAARVLARAVEMREATFRIFMAAIERARPSAGDVAELNLELGKALGRLRIGEKENANGFVWEWADEPLEFDYPLGRIAHSAAGLLASEAALNQVHQCRSDNCGWLFIDLSKNHSRCWCDMRDCGNLAKVRRHRQKLRSSSAQESSG
jgi:predicted RNA-binding Zn ribbon-like protein